MRFIVLLSLLLLSHPVFAEDMARACPLGYSVVNGKCTPPCETGTHRSLSGKCVATTCNQGEELVKNICLKKCPERQPRAEDGRCSASP